MFRIIAFIILLPLLFQTLSAQIAVTEFPEKRQLYPRDLSSNEGLVVAAGSVDNSGSSYTEIRLKIYRDNVLIDTKTQNLVYSTAGVAPFSLDHDITAELANYKYELYGFDGAETLEQSADSVVAGDAYIIQGESSAEGRIYQGTANGSESDYIRVFGRTIYANTVNDLWYLGQGDGDFFSNGNTGQWGLKMAKDLIDANGVPVAIFNGAHPGKDITFFFRDDAAPNNITDNYGRLLARVQKAGLENDIRALLWFHGETDADIATSTSNYKAKFGDLMDDWAADYAIDRFYMLQLRNGLFFTYDNALKVQEAQRQIADSVANMEIIGTSAMQHYIDFSHYPFFNGYELLGEDVARILGRDIYGDSDVNVSSPNLLVGEQTGLNQITLTTVKATDVISADPGVEAFFQIEGAGVTVTSVSVVGNTIVLTLSGEPIGATGVSYATPYNSTATISNLNGASMIAFENFPIGTFPVELLNFDGEQAENGIMLNWRTASEQNNKMFEIQKSINGNDWAALGQVDGAGNSQSISSYQFLDASPIIGTNLYRLKQVDFDGSSTLSNIVTVEINQLDAPMAIFPNPSKGNLNVALPYQDLEMVTVSMYNQVGQKVYETSVMPDANGRFTLSLNGYATGAYSLIVKSKRRAASVSKILLQE